MSSKNKKEVKPSETVPAKEGRAQVNDLRARFQTEALKIVHENMPAKVMELTKLLDEHPLWQYPDVTKADDDDETKVEDSSKKRKRENGMSPKASNAGAQHGENGMEVTYVKNDAVCEVNPTIATMQEFMKQEVQHCLSSVSKVKVWIQLNIPKVEDGNNFGVSIQEETVNELTRAEDTSFALLDSMNKYYISRAKLVSKTLKYPNLKDYTMSVQELDRKELVNMCLSLNDLRNNYCIMYDTITKNLEKISCPRSQVALPFI